MASTGAARMTRLASRTASAGVAVTASHHGWPCSARRVSGRRAQSVMRRAAPHARAARAAEPPSSPGREWRDFPARRIETAGAGGCRAHRRRELLFGRSDICSARHTFVRRNFLEHIINVLVRHWLWLLGALALAGVGAATYHFSRQGPRQVVRDAVPAPLRPDAPAVLRLTAEIAALEKTYRDSVAAGPATSGALAALADAVARAAAARGPWWRPGRSHRRAARPAGAAGDRAGKRARAGRPGLQALTSSAAKAGWR